MKKHRVVCGFVGLGMAVMAMISPLILQLATLWDSVLSSAAAIDFGVQMIMLVGILLAFALMLILTLSLRLIVHLFGYSAKDPPEASSTLVKANPLLFKMNLLLATLNRQLTALLAYVRDGTSRMLSSNALTAA